MIINLKKKDLKNEFLVLGKFIRLFQWLYEIQLCLSSIVIWQRSIKLLKFSKHIRNNTEKLLIMSLNLFLFIKH